MRTHRVLVREVQEGSVVVFGPEAHHLARVLRVEVGQPVQAFDGSGREAEGVVAAVTDHEVELRLGPERITSRESPIAVELLLPLLKGDKLAGVVRQATELGVQRFRFVLTRRADVPHLSRAKMTRLERIVEEASKQSGRAVVPTLEEPVALHDVSWEGELWIGSPVGDVTLVSAARSWLSMDPRPLSILTGPEGGLEAREVDALAERGGRAVRLGPRILRAETAPIAFAAVAFAEVGD